MGCQGLIFLRRVRMEEWWTCEAAVAFIIFTIIVASTVIL
jgi:hypothetical protein